MLKFANLSKLLGDEHEGASDVLRLIRRYIVQETLVPIKRLGRAIGYCLLGALFVGVGSVFALIGLLRLLQDETGSAFGGKWSFAPYTLVVVIALVMIGSTIFLGFHRRDDDNVVES